jgi:hypothetical protein
MARELARVVRELTMRFFGFDRFQRNILSKSRVQRTLLANSDLFGLLMIFGPGLGSALLLVGMVFWAGRDMLGQGRL